MPIDAVAGARPGRHLEDPTPFPQPPAPPPRPSRTADAHHDANVVAFVANAKPRNDGICYVGMNDASKHAEAEALGPNVKAIFRSDATSVTLGGTSHDLTTPEGTQSFARALAAKYGLAPESTAAIAKLLDETEPGARDELARLAMVMAPGEKGAAIPSRFVFSGHSTGSVVYGKDRLSLDVVRRLGEALPNAAKQVEDIHFSGCMTSEQVYRKDDWQKTFPNLKTMWGYSAIAPGAPTGHLQTWEAATRGRTDANPRHGIGGVTTWSARSGIDSAKPLAELRAEQPAADADYADLMSGKLTSGPWGRAKSAYETYRELSNRPDVPATERPALKERADALFRLRHYDGVAKNFMAAHRDEVRAAYESLGLRTPDFGNLTRAQGLAAMDDFVRKAQTARPIPPAALKAETLLHHLRTLDHDIPEAWCE